MSKSANKTDNNKGKKNVAPGQLLRQAREARKLSIESVAERLHLAVGIIHALENAEYGKLPAPTYIRGYLRSYATYVGIDGDKLVDEYNLIVGDLPPDLVLEAIPSAPQPGRKPDGTVVILSVVVVASLLALIGWLSSGEEPQLSDGITSQQQEQVADSIEHVLPEQDALSAITPDSVSGMATEAVSTPVVGDNEAPVKSVQETVPVTPVRSEPEKVVTVETNPRPAEPEPAAIAETSPAIPEPAPAPVIPIQADMQGKLRLSLAFDGSSWVEVHDANNKRLLMRLARAGSRYNIAGEPPLHVLLGNAPVVRLMVNDKAFSHQAYIHGKVARFDIQADSE